MRTTLVVIAVLAMSGCTPKSHRLLGEGEDGGAGSPSATTWTSCTDGASMGRHMDACSGWGGSECGSGGHIATCIAGQMIRVQMERLGWGEASVCTDPFVFFDHGIQVTAVADGCADLWICESTSAWNVRVCQRDPLPGVRPEAVGSTPWTDCAAALQSGKDGDPCEGELRCADHRSLSPGTSSNVLLVVCDAGVLRMMPMMSVIHPVDI